jgi:hypothetical protein
MFPMADIRSAFRDSFKLDRLDILDTDVAYQLNTYRNWGEVDLTIEPFPETMEKDTKPLNAKGTKSLFNNVHSVYYGSTLRRRNNMPLIDTKMNREVSRNESDCSVRALIENSKMRRMGRAVYNYSDFMYCKELGRVSNNYLVTLRRFPSPCGDNVLFVDPDDTTETNPNDGLQMHSPDIGRMVTWIGVSGNEMSNILKYDFKMPFKETNAEWQQADDPGGDSSTAGPIGALLNGTDKKYRQYMIDGRGGTHSAGYVGRLLGGEKTTIGRIVTKGMANGTPYSSANWRTFRDNNKVYGPVDAVKKTTVRSDEGLDFNHSITLTFDYEMRSYDGINTKAAFLDLLANILAVTYSTGTFWGGGYRGGMGSPQSNVFANLPIFQMAEKGQLNSFGDLVNGVTNSLSSIWSQISQGEGLIGAIKTLGSSLFSMFTGAALNQLGRPTKVAMNSLLEPVPTGLWHLTIGNPMHPIMVLGNMILDKTEIEHYGPLGLDDFPTGLRVTCTLHHGKPRDTTLIENMYVLGHSRIYVPMGPDIDKLYAAASDYKDSERYKYRYGTYFSDRRNSQSGADSENLVSNPNGEFVRYDTDSIVDQTTVNVQELYFGTTNTKLILNAGKEVAYGAQPIDSNNKGTTSPADGNGGSVQI